jgi:hypothetical protein
VELEAMTKAKKIQPDAFAAASSNTADRVLGDGWIEAGPADYTRSFVRALD